MKLTNLKYLFLACTLILPITLSGCSKTEASTEALLPTKAEEASIYVEPIANISDDFIRGMDVSSILSEEKSGVVYYNEAGEVQDVFKTMAQAGVNYARIRVWNDPYDSEGHGYGGGNCDLATAIELGKRATQYGMKVCIDFHYSDFWADPKKQFAPKAWEGMSINEKCDALYSYTRESMNSLLDAGVDVCMVQIGNETNNGMAGEKVIGNITMLMNAGSKAIREISTERNKEIQIALHYTNASDYDGIDKLMYKLASFQTDYDIFALSYYPYWHGSFENIKNVMENVQNKYGKKTLIAETSYCYTLEDGDGYPNSIDEGDLISGYGASVQSQSTALRDVCAVANEAGALGVFYWEGAWIPVGNSSGNSSIWETYGSGWASKYASDYDPDDAGQYYGGCSWDNQALFDHEGKPLASLNTFKWLKYGTVAEPAIDIVDTPYVTLNLNDNIVLPDTVNVVYNNRSLNTSMPVTWNEDEILAIDTSVVGSYKVFGKILNDNDVYCNLSIEMLNYVKNPSFEDDDTSMWNIEFDGDKNPTDFLEKGPDAHSGVRSFHFWSESKMNFAISQTLSDLEPGTYVLKAHFQGGDIDDASDMNIFAYTSEENKQTCGFKADGYANWQTPSIQEIVIGENDTLTIGASVACNAKGWGTIDDFVLNKIK